VDVDAGVNVVKEIPADMVGILVHDKIIGAIPAPIGTKRPIPGCDFKTEATAEPETMVIGVETLDAITEGRTKVLEAPVREGMVHVEALIVRGVVPIPMVVVDVLSFVDAALGVALALGFSVGIVPLGRSRGNMALIGARRVLTPLLRVLPPFFRMLSPFFRVLSKNGKGQENCDSKWE